MMRLGFSLATLCVALGVSPAGARAQHWYDTVLPDRSHDLGTVARGSKVRHTFRVVNTTSQEVHIADFRTKCGCTEVKIGARDIPPGTQTGIEVTLDTTRFEGYKASGLTLIFDKPEFVQVDLNLTSFIRGEIRLDPGNVDFQNVPRGSEATRELTLVYQGARADWTPTRLTTLSEFVTAELSEIDRAPGATRFRLKTTLSPDTPPGHFRDEINLYTNDPEAPTIPISVHGEVQPAFSIAPSILNLGRLRPGQKVEKTVLVRASRPFRITSAQSARPDLIATGAIGQVRPLHTLTLKLTVPSTPGPFNAALTIQTDLDGEPPAQLTAFATIVP